MVQNKFVNKSKLRNRFTFSVVIYNQNMLEYRLFLSDIIWNYNSLYIKGGARGVMVIVGDTSSNPGRD